VPELSLARRGPSQAAKSTGCRCPRQTATAGTDAPLAVLNCCSSLRGGYNNEHRRAMSIV